MPFDLERFREFCDDTAATMVARACRDKARIETFECHHELGPPPAPEDVRVLDRVGPAARNDLDLLYAYHAYAHLFVVGDAPAIELLPPSEWEALRAEVDEWWRDARDEMEGDERELLESAIAFGQIREAATYFLLTHAGSRRGKVIMFCHDGLELTTLAESFGEFLEQIPEKAVHWVAGDVRYTSGKLSGQFYPIEYRPRGVE